MASGAISKRVSHSRSVIIRQTAARAVRYCKLAKYRIRAPGFFSGSSGATSAVLCENA